jgi:glycosyltransferase involved in cell wall biosynthesis
MNRLRVAHLVSHPIQYFAPLYRELAARPEIDLTVYFFSDATVRPYFDPGFGRNVAWDVELLGGYRHVFVPSARATPIGGPFWRRRNLDVARELLLRPPDVIWAHGYAHLTTWLAFAAARLRGVPFLIREEQTLLRQRPRWRRALKAMPLRILLRSAHGLAVGEANRDYLLRYGLPQERIFSAPYCVDNATFRRRAADLASSRRALRLSFGVTDDAPVVLFVGKFDPQKNVRRLLEAFEVVRREQDAWLLLVGDGVMAREIRAQAAERVLTPGFLNQSEVTRAYAAADILALPSAAETWGLVVNEAMNFGLPVVVSDRVGCGRDLVRDGANGFVVPHDDVAELARALEALVGDADLRRRMGASSRKLVSQYTITACADGIVHACVTASAGSGIPVEASA